MPKLNGRYSFRAVAPATGGRGPKTEVTYELDIGFAMGIPDWTHRALVTLILDTALGAFRSHIEAKNDFFSFVRKGPF
jgi:hypothetical protein